MLIERRLIEWLGLVAEMDCLRPTVKQVQQLRSASVVAQSTQQQKGVLSPVAISQTDELLQMVGHNIRQAATALGFGAADQEAFFAVDYETRANAWEAMQAGAANRAAAIDNGQQTE